MEIKKNSNPESAERDILQIEGDILAIDFGTYNTSASFEHNGQIVSVVFAESLLMPSALYWPKSPRESNEICVGQRAYAHSFTYGEERGFYLSGLKYELGSTIHTRKEFRNEMSKVIPIDDRCYGLDPEDGVSLILRFVKEEAERQAKVKGLNLSNGFERVVIGVPSRANQAYRTSMKRAAEMAGFKSSKLVAEPVAACRYYLDRHSFPKGELLLVFDMGAGTTDLTIVRYEGNKNFHVLISYGNTRLGGNDIDLSILKNILLDLKCDDYSVLYNFKNLDKVRRLKEEINSYFDSERISASRKITIFMNEDEIPLEVNSIDIIEAAQPIALQVLTIICDTFDQYGNTRESSLKEFPRISNCILIGGATRTIKINKQLKEIGKIEKLMEYISPDIRIEFHEPETAVSHGLMLFGKDWKYGQMEQRERFVYTRSPLDVGVAVVTRDDKGKRLDPKCYRHHVHIEQNSIPGRFPPKFYGVPEEDLEEMISKMSIVFLTGGKFWVTSNDFEIELKRPNECRVIGKVIVDLEPPRLGKYVEIRIQYVLDSDGIFKVSVTPMGFEDLSSNSYYPDKPSIGCVLEHDPLPEDVVRKKIVRNKKFQLVLIR